MPNLNPRLWSTKAKAVGTVVALAVSLGGALALAHYTDTPGPQTVAAVAAVLSLASTALAAYNAFARTRRKDTLDAFSAWSDKHYDARVSLSKRLGSPVISQEQAAALVGAGTLLDREGEPIAQLEKQSIREDLCAILNGLERLAVGVNLSIYDERVLRKIGGTIVVRTHTQFGRYIEERHKEQPKAYEQLAILVQILDMTRLDATIKGYKDSIDKARAKNVH